MLRNFLSTYFWVTFVALTIASGLFWLGSFRHTQGHISLLILPKTETAIVAPANAKNVLFTESFEKHVLAQGAERAMMVDWTVLEGNGWAKHIEAEVVSGSSLLEVTAMLETRDEAKQVLELLTKELVHQLSQFYSFESELDLRVIDGPWFETRVSSWTWFIGTSVGSGFGVTLAFFLVLSLLERIFSRRATRQTFQKPYHISPETFRPKVVPPYWSQREAAAQVDTPLEIEPTPATGEQPETYAYEETFSDPNPVDVVEAWPEESDATEKETMADTQVFEEETSETMPTQHGVATGPAPDNLPIADDLSPLEAATARLYKADIDATAAFQATQAEAVLGTPTAVEELRTAEPTQAEYKRRLNELLSGRL